MYAPVYIGTRALGHPSAPSFCPATHEKAPKAPPAAHGPLPCPAAISLSMFSCHLHFSSHKRPELVSLASRLLERRLSSSALVIPLVNRSTLGMCFLRHIRPRQAKIPDCRSWDLCRSHRSSSPMPWKTHFQCLYLSLCVPGPVHLSLHCPLNTLTLPSSLGSTAISVSLFLSDSLEHTTRLRIPPLASLPPPLYCLRLRSTITSPLTPT